MFPVYEPPSSVAFENDLTWFLKERVVVTWPDAAAESMYLGEPSPLNRDTSLVLWAGLNKANDHLVILLQLTITHYSSKRRKRFEVFLTPADLHPAQDTPTTRSIDDTPTGISEAFGQVGGTKRFLCLSLQKSAPSDTLMPLRTGSRPLQGTPEHILLQAKCFSEHVRAFDVYIGYSTYAYEGLRHLLALLNTEYVPVAFRLKDCYNHNGGGINLWIDYVDTRSSRKAADLDGTDLASRHGHRRKRARLHSGQETGSYHHSKQHEGQEHQAELQEGPPPYVEACTHSPQAAQVQVPASNRSLSPTTPTRCNDTSFHTVIPSTPPNQDEETQNSFLNLQTTPPSPPAPPFSPLATHRPLFPLSSNLTPLADATHLKTTLYTAFTTWLYKMHLLTPNPHENPSLYPMLVAFGLSIHRNDLTRFPIIKARATSIVLKHHVTSPSASVNWQSPPEKLVQRLIRWMCGMIIDADEVLIEELGLLMQKAVALDGGKEEAKKEFLWQQARCVTRFFVTYAWPLSRCLKMQDHDHAFLEQPLSVDREIAEG